MPCVTQTTEMITTDFLVIGSGVAGLSFALRAAKHGKVIVLCKSDPLVSSSAKAQGGIAAVMDKNDTFDFSHADTKKPDASGIGLG